MKLIIKRGRKNGIKFCIWKMGDYQNSGNFFDSADYVALTGKDVTVQESLDLAGCRYTNVYYFDVESNTKYHEMFQWGPLVNLSKSPIKVIKKELTLRKKDILEWINRLDSEEILSIEI